MASSTLFLGARVFTGRRYCSALLVENGEVEFAGTEAEARRQASTGTEVRHLTGGLILPGLIDAHLHVAELTRSREGLNLRDVRSVDELAERVRGWAEAHPTGPLVGRSWDPERFAGGRWLSREELDRLSPDRPLGLAHVSGHALLVNSPALAEAGISRTTPDPPGGRYGRAPDGTPDGRIFESAIADFDSRLPQRESVDPAALRRTLAGTASLGLTTVGAMSADPGEAVALRQLASDRELPCRVRVYLRGDRWSEYFRDPGGPSGSSGWFAVVGVKAYTDGAFGPRTAWLSAPYADDPGNVGMPAASDDALRALLTAAAERGLDPALHAIGDRALGHALDLLEEFAGGRDRPGRIEHASLTPPASLPALGRVRPALVVQPGFVWSDTWLSARLGPERARWAYAFRTLSHLGHLLVGSSDAPYDPPDPWRGLHAAVRRTDPAGRSANPAPEETLGPEEALVMYGGNAGRAWGEPLLGLLESGSPADLIWVRAASLDVAIAQGSGGLEETWVAGERVLTGTLPPEVHSG
jgi:predicted amidohydrolase YtcJ